MGGKAVRKGEYPRGKIWGSHNALSWKEQLLHFIPSFWRVKGISLWERQLGKYNVIFSNSLQKLLR